MRHAEARDGTFGLLGRVAIAAPPGRSATGGVRAVESLDRVDLDALAATMARKYAFLPFPKNGAAKAAIVLPLSAPPEERRERLRAFGRALADAIRAGTYRPWTDLGTTADDLREIYEGAGAPAPEFGDSGLFTAYSVAGAGLAACDALGIAPRGARAAIQGFGSVGRELLASLSRLGFKVVSIANRTGCVLAPQGIDVAAAVARGERFIEEGGLRGPKEGVLEAECDVFFACADARVIDAKAAEAIAARAVVPGANDPCAPGAEEILLRRGVLLLPDFVANAGGILGSFLSSFGLDRARLERFEQEAWRGACGRLLELARRRGLPPLACAREAVDPSAVLPWLSRKLHGAFYRLARAPGPLRRLAGEAALAWAERALGRRFRGR
jgi:glutamate dehydrogenase (NAD(P)+)